MKVGLRQELKSPQKNQAHHSTGRTVRVGEVCPLRLGTVENRSTTKGPPDAWTPWVVL